MLQISPHRFFLILNHTVFAGMKAEDAYNIRKPIGSSIFFAGEHTTFPEGVYGTVHGAYLSGIRAAKEILELRTDNILLHEQTKVIKFLPK